MPVTLEQLLTHPRAFGLTTATPVQRAICRIADGLPLAELADVPEVQRSLGGAAALAALPTVPPTELYVVAAIRCGKSLLSGALAMRTALTIDLSFLATSEIARVSVVSLDRDKAKIVGQHLLGALERPGSALRKYLLNAPKPTDERMMLRRDDGRRIEIVVAAGRRGGSSLVSRWTVAAIFDEAARMLGQEDGVVNFDDMRKSVIARLGLLPGAQLVAVTSPWAARGPIYDATQESWGRPSQHLVVVRATGPEMNPVIWTPEACEAERLRPNGSYETDVLGEFVDPEGGLFTAAELRAATRQAPVDLPREDAVEYTAAMDPATTGNAWAVVVVGKRPGAESEAEDRYFVAAARQWQGSRVEPLKAREVFAEMAPLLAAYGVTEVHTDRWGGSLLAEHGDYAGVAVVMAKEPAETVARRHADFRTLILDGRLELAPHPVLVADLLAIKKRLLPGGGLKFDLPVTRDGRHADFAPAAVLAVAKAAGAPTWVHAMNRERARRLAVAAAGAAPYNR